MVRVDRSTANLAAAYDTRVGELNGALKGAGFAVTRTMAASLYEGELLWSGDVSAIDGVLSARAQQTEAVMPTGCPAKGMAKLLSTLNTAQVNGFAPCAAPLGVLVVVDR